MQQKFGAEVTMIEGGGGIFDVTVDGTLAYSKKQTGHFPSDDDLGRLG